MSSRLNTEHHEYLLSDHEFAERLPDVLNAFDEPFSGTVSTFFLSILIHRHVKVALSGDGADELFGSYLAHRLAWPIHHLVRLKQKGKTQFRRLERFGKESPGSFYLRNRFSLFMFHRRPRAGFLAHASGSL